MKTQARILVLIGIFFITAFSCEKTKPVIGCGTEYPVKNLVWLKSLVNFYSSDTTHNWDLIELNMYDYNNSNAFVFDFQKAGVYDVPITVYDCTGYPIFTCSGFQKDSCVIFFQSASNKKLIWKRP